MSRGKRWIFSVGVIALVGLGCSAYGDLANDAPREGNLGGGFRNNAAPEGRYSMDSELCWQGIDREKAAASGGIDAAYQECMAGRGWSNEPGVPAPAESR